MNDSTRSGGAYNEPRIVNFLNKVTFQTPVEKFSSSKVTITPNVNNIDVLIPSSGGALTVTNFLNGAKNQQIRILGDGFCTISNNANIKTNTGANKLLAANKVYRFSLINSVWYEDA
jgi:hypothetical protein